MRIARYALSVGWSCVMLLAVTSAASGDTTVVVFNFHMTSDTPEWLWLEKGLADRVTTDLFQSHEVNLMARDRMQELAEKMTWVPEMMEDPRQLKKIGYKTGYVVSGTYAVQDDKLTITAQVVDFETTKEVFRRQVSGPPAEALDLVRRLSAELLAWLTHKTPEEVKGDLPVWTRSIPAAKALYEGVDLYDQGRYAEGWLNFRRAAKEDPGYTEAQYWVGKMYYFMNRYDHARRAFEQFVYIDDNHPRMGDAIIEYVRTYEMSGATAETLLTLYRTLWNRFQKENESDEVRITEDPTRYDFATDWLRRRAAIVLQTENRHREAIDVLASRDLVQGGRAALMDWKLVPTSVRLHNTLTGQTFTAKELDRFWHASVEGFVVFDEQHNDVLSDDNPNGRTIIKQHIGQRRPAKSVRHKYCVAAPSGYVLTSLRVFPQTEAAEGSVEVAVVSGLRKSASTRSAPLSTALKEGVLLAPLPRTGLMEISCQVTTAESFEQREQVLHGVRVVGNFERLVTFGALDLACTNSAVFDVHVDGVWTRSGPGLIGLLTPGPHSVQVQGGGPWGEITATAQVEANRATRIEVSLPLRQDAKSPAWTISTLIGSGYPGYVNFAPDAHNAWMAHHDDDEGIRVIWSYGLDLWSSVSVDGKTFTPPRMLDLPVSTAWTEEQPELMRDEQGRFLLRFRSNRDILHKSHPYLTWSRDFEHWSAPVRMPGSGSFFQNSGGQFVLVGGFPSLDIWLSRNAVDWRLAAKLSPSREGFRLDGELMELDDGSYVILATEWKSGRLDASSPAKRLCYYHSSDLAQWSPPEFIADICSSTPFIYSVDDTLEVVFSEGYYESDGSLAKWQRRAGDKVVSRTDTYRRNPDGHWERVVGPASPHRRAVSRQRPSRWGDYEIRMVPRGHEWDPHPSFGPFFLRREAPFRPPRIQAGDAP